MRLPERALTVKDDRTVFYDDNILLTRTDARTVVELPLVPYSFQDRAWRLALGRATTLALGGLGDTSLRFKVVHLPTSTKRWGRQLDEDARKTRRTDPAWDAHRELQVATAGRRQALTKHVYLESKLGHRSFKAVAGGGVREGLRSQQGTGWVNVASSREIARWTEQARARRQLLADGAYDAVPVSVDTLRLLRLSAVWRNHSLPLPSAARRSWWDRAQIVDEFGDVLVTPVTATVGQRLVSCVRVDSPAGSTHTATFVMSAFPVTMQFPDMEPWMGWLDYLPGHAEADLLLDLRAPRRALRDIARRFNLAKDQERDAARAGSDVPREVAEVLPLVRDLEYELVQSRLPVAYGYARIRVDGESPADVAAKFEACRDHYRAIGGPGIDVAWPGGAAQVDLLREAVPGQTVRHRSWRQVWLGVTAAHALPHVSSGLSQPGGSYVGYTIGRSRNAVKWSPHTPLRRRAGNEVEQASGVALTGAMRAGKSSALGLILYDGAIRGSEGLLIDFAGPLARALASHSKLAGRVRHLDLNDANGLIDPLGPHLVPGDPRTDTAVRVRRQRLAMNTLRTVGWEQLHDNPAAAGELAEIIMAEVVSDGPRLLNVVRKLKASRTAQVKALGKLLAFDLDAPETAAAFGEGSDGVVAAEHVLTVMTAEGVRLPLPGDPISDWEPDQRLGAALFGLGTYLGSRLLWDLPMWIDKLFAVDEAHVALATPAGRGVIETNLRFGPKHSIATILATHNTRDLGDEKIAAAISTRFQFRTTSDVELEQSFQASRWEDTKANREKIRNLPNGACIASFPPGRRSRAGDVRDIFQWDLYEPELAGLLITTPELQAAA